MMSRNSCVFLLLIVFLFTPMARALEKQKGILIYSIEKNKEVIVEAGKAVTYSPAKKARRLVIEINGKQYEDIPDYYVIPFDPEFSMSRVYIQLTESHPNAVEYRYMLAKNALEAIPSHPLREEVFALFCQYAKDYHIQHTHGKKVRPVTEIIKQFLQEFPNSMHREALEWQLFKLETEPYEYEGDVPTIETSIERYESYIESHPDSRYTGEAQLRIAFLNRMAYESLKEGIYPAKIGGVRIDRDSKMYTESDKQDFIERAKQIYKQLLRNESLEMRERARVALYNIEHGRRGYINPNDW